MNIVAIETATETVGVALRAESGAEATFTLRGGGATSRPFAPAMGHLFDQVGLAPTDPHVVAVDLGPGLFTGLRAGVAAAKGLAQAVGVGVLGLSSLDVLTQPPPRSGTSASSWRPSTPGVVRCSPACGSCVRDGPRLRMSSARASSPPRSWPWR